MTTAPAGIIRKWQEVCRQDFGWTTKVENQEQQSNQDAQTSRKEMDETECPVKTGWVLCTMLTVPRELK
jgi:hypothetical protein